MKCIHCKEKIAKNEPRCSKCGKEIDENHWSWKAYKIMSLIVFWVNMGLNLAGGALMGWIGAGDFRYEIFNGNDELKRLFTTTHIICLFIQLGGFIVHLLTTPITLYALYERKWNAFTLLIAAIPTLMYGYNLAYVVIYSMFGEYPRIGLITSLLVFVFTFAMFCVALVGARRITARKRAWRKKVKQMTGKDDENLINCEVCGADLPLKTENCPVCGKEIDYSILDVPDNLAIWCASLAFRLNGARRRRGEHPLFIGRPSDRFDDMVLPDMYSHEDYNLPADATKSYMFDFGGRSIIWSLIICIVILFVALSDDGGVKWVDQVGGNVFVPVYWFTAIACIVVLIATSILNKHIMKAINYKEWNKDVSVKLLTSLGIRLGLTAVLVIFMLFLDFRVVLTIPFLAFLCITQLALLLLSRIVKKRIELYNEYAKDMIEKRNPESVTIKKYKNRKYMNMD